LAKGRAPLPLLDQYLTDEEARDTLRELLASGNYQKG
jgi:hypothetical protein